MIVERRFPTVSALMDALSRSIAATLREAIASRGRATWVVSGGRTPGPLFDRLARTPLEWDRVAVTLSDERWVPPNDPRSNEHLVRERLLTEEAARAHFVGLWVPRPSPSAALAEIAARTGTLPRPFDVVTLGIGEDGHFASLFPGDDAGLTTDVGPLVATRSPDGCPRISWTRGALTDARRIVLHVTGEAKWAVMERARAGARGANGAMHPVASLLHLPRIPVEIWWAPV